MLSSISSVRYHMTNAVSPSSGFNQVPHTETSTLREICTCNISLRHCGLTETFFHKLNKVHRHCTVTEEHDKSGRGGNAFVCHHRVGLLLLLQTTSRQTAILVPLDDEFGPSLIEENPHVVSGFANRAVVLVENLTVAEHQVHILTKLVP